MANGKTVRNASAVTFRAPARTVDWDALGVTLGRRCDTLSEIRHDVTLPSVA
jgi:hypothetical protein